MASPTAGIDPTELIDIRSMLQAIDAYIQNTPDLIGLPPKFSIGIDGGGQVGIGTRPQTAWQHRYNEIQLSAIAPDQFKLTLGGKQFYQTNVLIKTSDCLSAIAALTHAYLEYVQLSQSQKKPRLRDLLNDWGVEKYLDRAAFQFDLSSNSSSNQCISTARSQHLGIQTQKQPGLSSIGIALQLGCLSIVQLKRLIHLSETYGSGELRLTPWQSILLPNISAEQTSIVLTTLKSSKLSIDPINAIVACAGKPGCASSETHTQAHAIALMPDLNHLKNIHITGCPKRCAQPSPAEITLLGTTIQGSEAYSVFAGDRALTEQPIPASELSTIAHLINALYD
jgi:ferredoxin-nitrite reductase